MDADSLNGGHQSTTRMPTQGATRSENWELHDKTIASKDWEPELTKKDTSAQRPQWQKSDHSVNGLCAEMLAF